LYTSFKNSPRPGAPKRREDWVDVAWSLMNSIEFRYRH
jgi:hypothetical protein